MGKYVAVGVLAVIVLAAATYEKPKTEEGQRAAQAEQEAASEPVYSVDYQPIEGPVAAAVIESATPISIEPAQIASALGAEPETVQAVAQAAQVLEYTVKKGQTLSDVAGELLGDRGKWRELYEANKDRLPSPDQVRAGIKLIYQKSQQKAGASQPSAPAGRPAATSMPASAPRGKGYTVAKGDTLYSIAKKTLGKGTRWKEIAELNGLQDGQVKVGQRLKLPE